MSFRKRNKKGNELLRVRAGGRRGEYLRMVPRTGSHLEMGMMFRPECIIPRKNIMKRH